MSHEVELFEARVLIDGLVHSYKCLTYRMGDDTTRTYALMCGNSIPWLRSNDERIVVGAITCIACLTWMPKAESLRPWTVSTGIKE